MAHPFAAGDGRRALGAGRAGADRRRAGDPLDRGSAGHRRRSAGGPRLRMVSVRPPPGRGRSRATRGAGRDVAGQIWAGFAAIGRGGARRDRAGDGRGAGPGVAADIGRRRFRRRSLLPGLGGLLGRPLAGEGHKAATGGRPQDGQSPPAAASERDRRSRLCGAARPPSLRAPCPGHARQAAPPTAHRVGRLAAGRLAGGRGDVRGDDADRGLPRRCRRRAASRSSSPGCCW